MKREVVNVVIGYSFNKKTPQIVKFRELSVENTQCKDLYNLT